MVAPTPHGLKLQPRRISPFTDVAMDHATEMIWVLWSSCPPLPPPPSTPQPPDTVPRAPAPLRPVALPQDGLHDGLGLRAQQLQVVQLRENCRLTQGRRKRPEG